MAIRVGQNFYDSGYAADDAINAQRSHIAQVLAAQALGLSQLYPNQAPMAPPDIDWTSDPAVDPSLGEVVANMPAPPTHYGMPNPAMPSPPAFDLEAPAPENQLNELTPDPLTPNTIVEDAFDALDNPDQPSAPPTPQSIIDDAFDQLAPPDFTTPDFTSPDTADPGDPGGMAIASDITGALTGLNAAVNDAAMGYAVDQGFGGDPGGFGGSPGGFGGDPGGGFSGGTLGGDVAGGPGTGLGSEAASGEGGGGGSGGGSK